MISGIAVWQQRKKILRERIQIPRGKKSAQPVQNVKIRAVAVPQPQAWHAAVLAHAAHNQQIRKFVRKRQQARNGITGKIDERLIDNYKLHIPRAVKKFPRLSSGNDTPPRFTRL